MNTTQRNKGFTIIEVVLVLAIAGLIFLMVFVALPALQAGQRDNARKSDVGNIVTAISTYSSNNRGGFPTTAAQLGAFNADTGKWSNYMSAVSSNITSITFGNVGNVASQDGVGTIVKGAKCGAPNGASVTVEKGTVRQYVVITQVEAGGGSAFCQDS